MRCCVILINFKAVSYRGDKLIQLHKSIFIKLFKAFICNLILIGIKIIKIAEAEASRISDFSVIIRKLLQNFGADSDICMIIRRSNPKAKNICAVFLNDILRSNAVSKGFRHFFAFAVNSPSMSDDLLKRSAESLSNRGEKRGLEPTSVLIRTLKINIGGSAEIRPFCKHGLM